MAQGLKVYALGFRVLRVLGFKVLNGFLWVLRRFRMLRNSMCFWLSDPPKP